jgi:hypothetical protein
MINEETTGLERVVTFANMEQMLSLGKVHPTLSLMLLTKGYKDL